MKLVQIVEGGTRLFVPRASLEDEVPPTSPVFFNPVASVNRDVSVAITEAVGGATFCDALAGVGSRGLRVANEVQEKTEVTLVDFNRESLRAARRSAKANGVTARCRFVCSETNTFLHSRYGRDEKFDFVDVDPFGTPAPYLQALLSVSSNGGVTSVTATDTAALCGVYPAVSRRRYSATPPEQPFPP